MLNKSVNLLEHTLLYISKNLKQVFNTSFRAIEDYCYNP